MSIDLAKQISENLMIVCLRVSRAGLLGEKKDKKATDVVDHTFNVSKGNTRTTKALIAAEAPEKRAVAAADQNMKLILHKWSFPYNSAEMRILTAAAYPKYREEMDKAIERFWDAVDEYIHAYPRLILERKLQLGELFDPDQYPTPQTVKGMFEVKERLLPFPQTDTFFVKIASDAAAKVKKDITEDHAAIVSDACEHLMAKVEMQAREFIEKVSAYKERSKDAKKGDRIETYFKNSTVEHLKNTADLIERLNFTNDRNLQILANKCRNLARYSADVLKDNASYRKEVVKEGHDLLQSIEQLRTQDQQAFMEAQHMADFMA